MANKKYDGVIEAVHYTPDGQVDWVRVYLRRGAIWADRIIMPRQRLMDEIKAGKRMMVGKRIEFMAGTFDVTLPVQVTSANGKEIITTAKDPADRDFLEGVPLI